MWPSLCRREGKCVRMSSNQGQGDAAATGLAELRRITAASRGLVIAAIVFSVFINLLMLTGPLYMLQVYDRVLSSRSEPTLVALSGLVIFLFIAMGLLDAARSRVLARIGARVQQRLDRRVFAASLQRAAIAPHDPIAANAQRDLEAVQRFWMSPLAAALMDLPWTPLFLAAVFVFHPTLGWLAVLGGAILVGLTVISQITGKDRILKANAASIAAERMSDHLKAEAELLRALGMTEAAFSRWTTARGEALALGLGNADHSGGYSTATRTLRQFLQSAILGVGAWLVLRGELTAGAMIAGSILMGRALAPIEMAIGQWATLTRAREGKRRLALLLGQNPAELPPTTLPRPRALVEVENLSVVLPGSAAPVLRGVSFRLEPGHALGIIGPSGAGKSTLGRALVGAVRPLAGKIRLDGAVLDHYAPETLGRYMGYLPQTVTLLDGTVSENIARLSMTPDAEKVVRAAKAAAAHEMILRLPQGYDTPLTALGNRLSGGQSQRIGLARALYGDPVLLVLDEPNSNLDNDGSLALNAAIRRIKAEGGSVVVIAHRPAAIQECDLLLILEDGQRRAFGPRDEVLRNSVRNHTEIVRSKGPGGVS